MVNVSKPHVYSGVILKYVMCAPSWRQQEQTLGRPVTVAASTMNAQAPHPPLLGVGRTCRPQGSWTRTLTLLRLDMELVITPGHQAPPVPPALVS